MPCLPGFRPVVKFVHDTDEMVGMDERIGASVPRATSSPSAGIRPRAIRPRTSGTPTPSRPSTATRDVVGPAAPPPRRNRSRSPSSDLLLRHPDDFADGRDPGPDGAPAVFAQRAHALLDR